MNLWLGRAKLARLTFSAFSRPKARQRPTYRGWSSHDHAHETRNSHVRFWIIAVLFIVSSINYASRATLGIAGKPLSAEFHLDPVQLGYLFSAFGWAYVIGQIPGGALLDRYGSRPVYIWSITLWAVFTALQAFVSYLAFVPVMISLFVAALRAGLRGMPQLSRQCPHRRQLVSQFRARHRQRHLQCLAIFLGGRLHAADGLAGAILWLAQRLPGDGRHRPGRRGALLRWSCIRPSRHKRISKREYAYIEEGGALVNLDRPAAGAQPIRWSIVGQLLANRMLVGIYLAQYCINALTYFLFHLVLHLSASRRAT